MRGLGIVLLSIVLNFVAWPVLAEVPKKADPLFVIERSRNKNVVQYDARVTESRDLPDSNPVQAYWILENGRQEELNSIEKKYAYGVVRQEKLEQNKFKLTLAAFKNREILVEKIKGFFKAVVLINGQQSVLQKIYVKSEETAGLLPKVLYVDLIGKAVKTNLPVKERITPGRGDTTKGNSRDS
jgi:hypothetical protein